MPLLMSQRETRLLGSPLAENEKYKTIPKHLTVGELPVLPHMGRKYIAWISVDANNSNKNGSVACGNTLVMQGETGSSLQMLKVPSLWFPHWKKRTVLKKTQRLQIFRELPMGLTPVLLDLEH